MVYFTSIIRGVAAHDASTLGPKTTVTGPLGHLSPNLHSCSTKVTKKELEDRCDRERRLRAELEERLNEPREVPGFIVSGRTNGGLRRAEEGCSGVLRIGV